MYYWYVWTLKSAFFPQNMYATELLLKIPPRTRNKAMWDKKDSYPETNKFPGEIKMISRETLKKCAGKVIIASSLRQKHARNGAHHEILPRAHKNVSPRSAAVVYIWTSHQLIYLSLARRVHCTSYARTPLWIIPVHRLICRRHTPMKVATNNNISSGVCRHRK